MSRVQTKQITGVLGRVLAEDAASAARRFADRAEHEGLVEVAYASYDSPIGTGHVASTERGVVSIGLPNVGEEDFLVQLAGRISPRVLERPARLDPALHELDQYFDGRRRDFGLGLDWRLVGSEFSSRILRETAKLPYGVTTTYGELAARAGSPRAFRAAGTALGHNPIPIVVPCHRVLRAGGVLGQYGGGPEIKEFLLRLEGAIE